MNNQTSDWRQAINIGVIGGIGAVFIALLGMIEAFETRDVIGGVIDMGHVLMLLVFFMASYLVVSRKGESAHSVSAIVQGTAASAISSLFLAGLVLVLTALPATRSAFVNATPKLINALTFGQDTLIGIFLLVLASIIVGVLPGLLRFLPPVWQRITLEAIVGVVLIGLLQELLVVTLRNLDPLKDLGTWLFARNGLSIPGVLTIVIIVVLYELGQIRYGKTVRERYASLSTRQRQITNVSLLLIVLLIMLSLPYVLGLFFSEILVQVGLYILMGLGLNIVVGFAGLLDLGYVAFFAIGAYTVGIITSTSKEIAFAGGFPFWVGLPIAVVMAAFAGIILGVPVLKVRGDYLAIVTLGFGEIIRLLALSDFLKPYFAGSRGLELIPKPFIGSFEFAGPQQLYYLLLIGCVFVAFIALRLKSSRIGRAWMAVREDEDVAQAMGINLVATKLLAFAMGASFAGIGGAINASKLAIIYPHSMNFLVSINVLALIIIGGMGSIPGVIVGALVLVGLPELLREFTDFRWLVYGAVLIVMMLVRPEGLLPEARRAMELEEFREEEEPDKEPVVTKTVGQP